MRSKLNDIPSGMVTEAWGTQLISAREPGTEVRPTQFGSVVSLLAIGCAIIASVLPSTVFSRPLELGYASLAAATHTSPVAQNAAGFYSGYAVLLGLMLCYLYKRMVGQTYAKPMRMVADAFCGCCALYLADYFLHASSSLYGWWLLFVLSLFFMAALFLTPVHARLVVYMLIAAVTVQSAYAIAYYGLGTHQFYTPHFGARTGGTFDNPNSLYPLSLATVPLCWLLARTASNALSRWGGVAIVMVNLAALVLTFTRSGWIALSASLLLLLVWPTAWRNVGVSNRHLVLVAAGLLLAGAVFLRTHGELIGGSHDRSFHGRLAIWNVAFRSIAAHPLLGTGIGTYAAQQVKYMTAQLQGFNPINGDPKNLYLDVLVQFGCIGFLLLANLAFAFARLARLACVGASGSQRDTRIVAGISLGFVALAIDSLANTPVMQVSAVASSVVTILFLGVTCALCRHQPPADEAGVDQAPVEG